jgi:hypothetical protein
VVSVQYSLLQMFPGSGEPVVQQMPARTPSPSPPAKPTFSLLSSSPLPSSRSPPISPPVDDFRLLPSDPRLVARDIPAGTYLACDSGLIMRRNVLSALDSEPDVVYGAILRGSDQPSINFRSRMFAFRKNVDSSFQLRSAGMLFSYIVENQGHSF